VDRALIWTLRLAALVAGALVLLIVAFLVREGAPALAAIGPARFFTDETWHPTSGAFGMAPMIAGSLLVTAGAVLIAAPCGLLAAVFSHFYAPRWVVRPFRTAVELLAGIPSVVYGFWALVVLVPALNAWQPPGASLLAGILVLAVMIVPTTALAADAGFAAVPRSLVDGARALGHGTWGTLRLAVLPASRASLVTGVLLQTGRALGETMAVLMVCGNIVQVPKSLFDPVRTLTANIALEMAYAMGEHRSALFVSGLLLMMVVSVLVLAASLAGRREMA